MTSAHSLTITHEIFVPRQIIFEVFTNPDHLMGWYSPGEGYERRVELDLRPGGKMRFVWSNAKGDSAVQEGEVVAVDAPAQVVYDIMPQDPKASQPNRVTINFVDLSGRTRIEIHQEGLEDESMRERQVARWQAFFKQLENYLSSI